MNKEVLATGKRKILAAAAAVSLTAAAVGYGVHMYQEQGNRPDYSVSAQQPESTAVYMPTWLQDEQYDRLASLLHGKRVDVVLAFSEPNGESLPAPVISGGVRKAVGGLAMGSNVSVAIGGWGSNDTHQRILDSFGRQTRDPQAFASRVGAMVAETSRRLGRPVNGIDIDWEYPSAEQAEQYGDMWAALDAKFPDARLTAAVPAANELEAYRAAMPALARHADVVRVMTYDQYTPYDDVGRIAGPVTSDAWALDNLRNWQRWLKDAGGPAVAAIGFPAYGYTYDGTAGAGDSFKTGSETPYAALDLTHARQEPDGSSSVLTPRGWTSYFGPADVRRVLTTLDGSGGAGKTPDFVWSADGLTADYLDALTGR